MVVHLFAKIGFAGSEAGTSLKLVEKGFKREDLAVMVLIDFPFQIVGGWLAAKWSRGDRPLRPWLYAFWPRFFFAATAAVIVYYFPMQPLPLAFFLLMIVHTVLSSFATYVHRFLCLFLTDVRQDCTICRHFCFPYPNFGSPHWRNIYDGRHQFLSVRGVTMLTPISSSPHFLIWEGHGQNGLCSKVISFEVRANMSPTHYLKESIFSPKRPVKYHIHLSTLKVARSYDFQFTIY